MMNYPQIPLPSRSDTLWKYTSWKKIHPTKVEEMPTADAIKFSNGEDFQLDDSEEIAIKRYETYEKSSEHVINYYKQSNLLKVINGEASISEISNEISGLIEMIKG